MALGYRQEPAEGVLAVDARNHRDGGAIDWRLVGVEQRGECGSFVWRSLSLADMRRWFSPLGWSWLVAGIGVLAAVYAHAGVLNGRNTQFEGPLFASLLTVGVGAGLVLVIVSTAVRHRQSGRDWVRLAWRGSMTALVSGGLLLTQVVTVIA